MKAYQLRAVSDLKYVDVELPSIEDGWALVKVKASGICSSDIPRIYEKGTYHFPTIPGHEFAGIVEDVKDDRFAHYIGKRVGVFPLIPCGKCPQCKNKKYEMCDNYDYIGSRRDGGFAEYVAVPVWNLIELPQNISFKEAAMIEPLAVGLHAVKKVDVKGKRVAVVGTGMIGLSVALWSVMLGASKVSVVGRSASKREMVEKLQGVEYKTDCEENDLYDVVVEAVGSKEAVINSITMAAAEGEVILMGNPAGDIELPQNIYWKVLRRQLKLIGTWNSSYDGAAYSDWTQAIEAICDNKIDVKSFITHCFEQDKLMDGLQLMKEHIQSYCKVMVEWNKE